jgi:hypothetical protein
MAATIAIQSGDDFENLPEGAGRRRASRRRRRRPDDAPKSGVGQPLIDHPRADGRLDGVRKVFTVSSRENTDSAGAAVWPTSDEGDVARQRARCVGAAGSHGGRRAVTPS